MNPLKRSLAAICAMSFANGRPPEPKPQTAFDAAPVPPTYPRGETPAFIHMDDAGYAPTKT